MAQPEDFGNDLATRIAVHEVILEKLVMAFLQTQRDQKGTLDTFQKATVNSFQYEVLTHGLTQVPPEVEKRLREQSEWGMEVAENFFEKIRRICERR